MTDEFDETDDIDPPRISAGAAGLYVIPGGGLDENRVYLYEGRPALSKIGPPLVAQGISQDPIVFALHELKEEGIIDFPGDNRLVLLKTIDGQAGG
jgi:hypothetical protein